MVRKENRRNSGYFWKRIKMEMRQLSKGMLANLDGKIKRDKAILLQDIKELDGKADIQGLTEDEWRRWEGWKPRLDWGWMEEEIEFREGAWGNIYLWIEDLVEKM
jgi:hypothetical protein